MLRSDCLQELALLVGDAITVVPIGDTTNEWNAVHPSGLNFFNLAMGSNLPLALGLAFALPHRMIVLLDTDGCQLMTLGALCTLGNHPAKNLRVFVMDNEAYASTGGQPSATAGKSDLAALARAAGVDDAIEVSTLAEFRKAAASAMGGSSPSYVVTKVELGERTTLSRGFDHVEAKYRFVREIERLEGKTLLPGE